MKNKTFININNLFKNEKNTNKLINNKKMKKFINIFILIKI
jgi:hypothetical protein